MKHYLLQVAAVGLPVVQEAGVLRQVPAVNVHAAAHQVLPVLAVVAARKVILRVCCEHVGLIKPVIHLGLAA